MSMYPTIKRITLIHKLVIGGSTVGERRAAAQAARVQLRVFYRATDKRYRPGLTKYVLPYLNAADNDDTVSADLVWEYLHDCMMYKC